MLRPRRKVTCFYCSTKLPKIPSPPEDANNFKCPSCSSWNRYDAKTGEIMSSEPAMFDESANISSFLRRATPSKTQLPPTFESSIFCHTCKTNQTLVTNLLANYLPPVEDPNYATALARLPAYRASLEVRYPLVCRSCLPALQERIKQKDHFARSQAFGGWLEHNRTGQRPGTLNRTPSAIKRDRGKPWDIWLWRVQGGLYILSAIWTAGSYFAGMRGQQFRFLRPLPPFVIMLSLLWIFFDRTQMEVQHAQRKGINLKVVGRTRFIQIQLTLWLSRLVASALVSIWGANVTEGTYGALLATEIVLAVFAWRTVQIIRPPPITLSRHASTTGSALKEEPLEPSISSLSDSFAPSKSPTPNPVFGLPSLLSTLPPATELTSSYNRDDMDWMPVAGDPSLREDDPFLLAPQRYPGARTGLESLFASASLEGPDNTFKNVKSAQVDTLGGVWNALRQRQGTLIVLLLTAAIILLISVLVQGRKWEAAWKWEQLERHRDRIGGLSWEERTRSDSGSTLDL